MGKEVPPSGKNPLPVSKTAPPASEGLIPIEQAARLLMVTAEWIRRLQKQDYIPKGPRGQVLLVGAVQGYIRFLKDEERRSSKSAGDSRVRDARAAEIEQRIAVKNRELVPAEDATAAMDLLVGVVRDEITGLPARVTRDIDERQKLEAEVHGSLDRISKALAASAKFVGEGGELPNAGPGDDA